MPKQAYPQFPYFQTQSFTILYFTLAPSLDKRVHIQTPHNTPLSTLHYSLPNHPISNPPPLKHLLQHPQLGEENIIIHIRAFKPALPL